jgi:hypothetical protein
MLHQWMKAMAGTTLLWVVSYGEALGWAMVMLMMMMMHDVVIMCY